MRQDARAANGAARSRFLPVALLASLASALSACGIAAQQAPPLHLQVDRREAMVPMRDGVRLFTVILSPKSRSGPLPIMLTRTPYGVSGVGSDGLVPVAQRELAADGYIFVAQDIRGRGRSEGTFVMNRAPRDPADPKGVDESTDTWDAVEWLTKNLDADNGRVGVMGVSYPGWLAGMAGVNPHPAVKAISPQAPMTDTWMGDDFFHQGAFRMSFGFEYGNSMEAAMSGARRAQIDRYDRYDWYLQYQTLQQLADANDALKLPTWRAFVDHPAYDAFWQAKAMTSVLTTPAMPVLMVGGFWDQEDLYGPIGAYKELEPDDRADHNYFVMGPWSHGQWSRPGGDALGNIRFGSNTADYYRENIQRPWFAYWLHDKGARPEPEAWVFESGGNRWRTFDAWPPREAVPARLYLRQGGRLSFDAPAAATGFDEYVSDPRSPVPYTPRPVDGTRWRQWLTEDQRFVHGRPDVLSWQTEPLTEDVVIAGDVVAHLFASTTGTDADWVVKLIDVYPDSVAGDPRMGGYQLMVNADIFRGRYWQSFSRPAPIPADSVIEFRSFLQQQLYRFPRGHRIMVQVQSTWFPLYDRNPQTFVENIFRARPEDFKAQVHRIWRTSRQPSHIAVNRLPG
jgi:hypothetical protein